MWITIHYDIYMLYVYGMSPTANKFSRSSSENNDYTIAWLSWGGDYAKLYVISFWFMLRNKKYVEEECIVCSIVMYMYVNYLLCQSCRTCDVRCRYPQAKSYRAARTSLLEGGFIEPVTTCISEELSDLGDTQDAVQIGAYRLVKHCDKEKLTSADEDDDEDIEEDIGTFCYMYANFYDHHNQKRELDQ